MEIELKKEPRCFKVGKNEEVEIQDWGKVFANENEMISFVTPEGKEYDVVAKEWGFYATPSVNGRLLKEGFKTALVKNKFGQYYVMLVDQNKSDLFYQYLEADQQEVVEWLDERN